jgi:hypothetical protein
VKVKAGGSEETQSAARPAVAPAVPAAVRKRERWGTLGTGQTAPPSTSTAGTIALGDLLLDLGVDGGLLGGGDV